MNLEELIHLAEKEKMNPRIIQYELQDMVEAIIEEFKKIQSNATHKVNQDLRESIMDSSMWGTLLFKKLCAFLEEQDKKHYLEKH